MSWTMTEEDYRRMSGSILERIDDLEKMHRKVGETEQKCLHKSCPDCQGTGVKKNGIFQGQPCIHMISCPCKRCSPYSLLEC